MKTSSSPSPSSPIKSKTSPTPPTTPTPNPKEILQIEHIEIPFDELELFLDPENNEQFLIETLLYSTIITLFASSNKFPCNLIVTKHNIWFRDTRPQKKNIFALPIINLESMIKCQNHPEIILVTNGSFDNLRISFSSENSLEKKYKKISCVYTEPMKDCIFDGEDIPIVGVGKKVVLVKQIYKNEESGHMIHIAKIVEARNSFDNREKSPVISSVFSEDKKVSSEKKSMKKSFGEYFSSKKKSFTTKTEEKQNLSKSLTNSNKVLKNELSIEKLATTTKSEIIKEEEESSSLLYIEKSLNNNENQPQNEKNKQESLSHNNHHHHHHHHQHQQLSELSKNMYYLHTIEKKDEYIEKLKEHKNISSADEEIEKLSYAKILDFKIQLYFKYSPQIPRNLFSSLSQYYHNYSYVSPEKLYAKLIHTYDKLEKTHPHIILDLNMFCLNCLNSLNCLNCLNTEPTHQHSEIKLREYRYDFLLIENNEIKKLIYECFFYNGKFITKETLPNNNTIIKHLAKHYHLSLILYEFIYGRTYFSLDEDPELIITLKKSQKITFPQYLKLDQNNNFFCIHNNRMSLKKDKSFNNSTSSSSINHFYDHDGLCYEMFDFLAKALKLKFKSEKEILEHPWIYEKVFNE